MLLMMVIGLDDLLSGHRTQFNRELPSKPNRTGSGYLQTVNYVDRETGQMRDLMTHLFDFFDVPSGGRPGPVRYGVPDKLGRKAQARENAR